MAGPATSADRTIPRASSTMALLDRARHGDRSALEELFARCVPPLHRWARGRLPRSTRHASDTLDLVQDVVVETLRQIDTFHAEREGALQAYLRRAVLNRIRDQLRSSARRPQISPVAEIQAPAPEPSPLEEAIGSQAVERYEAALARLDPIEREAVIARIELGYSYPQLAQALGRPSPEAARLALRRALVRLAEHMNHAA